MTKYNWPYHASNDDGLNRLRTMTEMIAVWTLDLTCYSTIA